jgi:hypothetical protein
MKRMPLTLTLSPRKGRGEPELECPLFLGQFGAFEGDAVKV